MSQRRTARRCANSAATAKAATSSSWTTTARRCRRRIALARFYIHGPSIEANAWHQGSDAKTRTVARSTLVLFVLLRLLVAGGERVEPRPLFGVQQSGDQAEVSSWRGAR